MFGLRDETEERLERLLAAGGGLNVIPPGEAEVHGGVPLMAPVLRVWYRLTKESAEQLGMQGRMLHWYGEGNTLAEAIESAMYWIR